MDLEPRRRNSEWERRWLPGSAFADDHPSLNIVGAIVLFSGLNVLAYIYGGASTFSTTLPFTLILLAALVFGGYRLKR